MLTGRGVAVFVAGLAMWVAARIVGSPGMEVVGVGLAALPFLAALLAPPSPAAASPSAAASPTSASPRARG